MTVDQVADYLQLSPLTVYRYVRQGRIRAAKIGKLYRMQKADVDEFLEQQKTGTSVASTRSRQQTGPSTVRHAAQYPRPIEHAPHEIYVGPSWRERRREQESMPKPTYPIEWAIRGLH